MVARLYPGDAVSGAPAYTGRALRQTQGPFLAGATAARPLGALSGVRPGTPSSTVTATSTTWAVAPFAGVIDLQTAAIAGPYTFAFDSAVTGTVTAAGASARIDALSVRVNDGAEGDGTIVAPFADIVYAVGTSSAPTVPARSFVIAYINVPATGGGSPTATWVAPFTVAAGGILPVPTTVYPASPYVGQYVDDSALALLRWNGSAWVTAGAYRATGTIIALTGGTLDAGGTLLVARGDVVVMRLSVNITSAPSATGTNIATLPVGFRPASRAAGVGVDADGKPVGLLINYDGAGTMRLYGSTAIGSVALSGTWVNV